MRKGLLWSVLALAGLLLTVGLVVGKKRGHEGASGTRTSTASLASPTRHSSQSSTPHPSGALRLHGLVRDDHGPVAGVHVSAWRPEPGETLSELPCPPELLARNADPDLPDPGLLGCTAWSSERVTELVLAREGEARVLAEATTAGDGTFDLEGLPEGTFTLWALGESGAVLRPKVSAGEENVDLWLEEGLVLEGAVTAEDGQTPLPEARVTVVHMEHTRFFDARAGADGRFRIGPVPKAEYAAIISADGWRPAFVPGHQPLSPDEPVRLSRPRRLTGRVRAPGGAPAPGLEVRVTYLSGEDTGVAQVTTTDAEGRFAFTSLPPGEHAISASRDGQHALVQVELTDAPPAEVVLTLGEARPTVGTVRDTAGRPVADAHISAFPWQRFAPQWNARSGPDGRYALGPMPAGDYVFSFSAPRHLALGRARRLVNASSGPVDFTLTPAVSVEGIVQDPEGQPLAGVELVLVETGKDSERSRDRQRSDEAGRFVLDAPAGGPARIDIDDVGFMSASLPVQLPSRDVRVVLRRGASVSGTVTDARGVPLTNTRVLVWNAETAKHVRGVATEEAGHFAIRGLEAGRYVLEARLQSDSVDRSTSRPVTLKNDEAVELSLRFEDGKALSGVVVDGAGRPVAGAFVRARLPTDAVPAWRDEFIPSEAITPEGVRSGSDGRFTLRHLEAAAYVLDAKKDGFTFSPEHSPGGRPEDSGLRVELKAPDVRLVLERQPHLRGRVVGPDGAPLTSFLLNGDEVRTPDGVFETPLGDLLDEAVLRFELSAPGLAPSLHAVDVPQETDVDLGTVRLEPGREVRGRVLDAETSAPLAGAEVMLTALLPDATQVPGVSGGMETGADGTFTLENVGRQPLTLLAEARDHLVGRLRLEENAEEVTVLLESGARVEVTVRDARGRPLAAHVFFHADWGYKDVDAPTGTAVVRGLPPGDYTVQARPRSEPPWPTFLSQRVHIPERGPLPLPLTEETGGATVVLRGEDPLEAFMLLPGSVPAPESLSELSALGQLEHPSDRTSKSVARVTFRHVPPGRVTVLGLGGPPLHWRIHREELDIPAEGTVTHDVHPVWKPLQP